MNQDRKEEILNESTSESEIKTLADLDEVIERLKDIKLRLRKVITKRGPGEQ